MNQKILVICLLLALILSACTTATSSVTPQTEPQITTNEVEITSLEILPLVNDQTQVRLLLRGTLPDRCAILGEPTISQTNQQIQIKIAYTAKDSENCGGPGEFEKIINLSNLSPGSYIVTVNQLTGTFETNAPPTAQSSPTPASTPLADSETTPVSPAPSEPSPTTVSPANPTGCIDKAAFFSDVTVPDNTPFQQNESFTKTWRIRNEGTCTWDSNYKVVFAYGDPMNGPPSFPIPETQPGQITDISVDLRSPSQGGIFTGNWQFENAQGKRFGVNSEGQDYIWVMISVSWYNAEGQPSAAATTTTTSSTCGAASDPQAAGLLLDLINQARANAGVPALTLNSTLSAAANAHSQDMACNNFLDHTGSNGSRWSDRIKTQGYNATYTSENIYAGSPDFGGTAQGAFEWWMNSAVHRNNILSTKVTEIGIGYAYNPSSAYGGYYTLNFAHP